MVAFASSLSQVERALAQPGTSKADLDRALEFASKARDAFLEKEDITSDKIIMAKTAKMFYEDVDKSQYPIGFYEALKDNFGPLNEEATYTKWAGHTFDNTIILDSAKWAAFVKNPDAHTLQNDPAFMYAAAFLKNYTLKYSSLYRDFVMKNNELGRLYLKGIMEKNPSAVKKMYPDANFSMRVSYGNVKSYTPRDGVKYNYVTTSKGILEKYIPGDYEFDLPGKEIELLKKRDFGQYIDKSHNDLIINFITTNDITGGNSGSPVMDAHGNLIGLAFDGNYEALSHKIQFDKDLNRTINVDIRYVLWCIDKLGGAKNIINELKLVR